MDEQCDIIFCEKQKFAIWVHVLIISALIFSVTIIISAMRAEFSGENSKDTGDLFLLLFGLALPIAIEILFVFLKLETEVRNDGVYVRLFPFHISFKKIAPQDIAEAYSRKYSPIAEYGGWGIRYSLKHGKAYNTRGNEGVQLILANGKKLLVGSQKAQELESAIKSIMR